jgi:hypothetical protein
MTQSGRTLRQIVAASRRSLEANAFFATALHGLRDNADA